MSPVAERAGVTRPRGPLSCEADVVVAVCDASPHGVHGCSPGPSRPRALAPATCRWWSSSNRAPRAAFRRGELYDEITDSLAVHDVVFVPHDRRVADAAWDGTVWRGLVHAGDRSRSLRSSRRCRGAGARTVGLGGSVVTTRTDAYDVIRRDAIAGVERRRLQPERQLGDVRAEIERAVDDYQRRARLGDGAAARATRATMVQRVLRSITELGPLSELLARRDVEEIFVEGARVTYLDIEGRLRGLAEPTTEEENRQILDRLLAATERQLNAKHPIVQARVLDGTARLTAAIPPIADRLSATVRRYTVRDVTLDALVARDALTEQAAAFLWALMQLRSRIVVSGEPGAGKTTLAAALLSAVPAAHCVRSCEEIRELAVPLVHGGYYEVRPAGLDGTGEISLRDLVKFVLAMRPDRIVVGEVRGAEAFELHACRQRRLRVPVHRPRQQRRATR